eukprot:403362265
MLKRFERDRISYTSIKPYEFKDKEFTMIKQREILAMTVNYEFFNELLKEQQPDVTHQYLEFDLTHLNAQNNMQNSNNKSNLTSSRGSQNVPLQLLSQHYHENPIMEQSIDIFSRIAFSTDLMINKVMQQQLIIECFSQLRQNIRHIVKTKDNSSNQSQNSKIVDSVVDINAIFNNLVFFIDKLIAHKSAVEQELYQNNQIRIEQVKEDKKFEISQLQKQNDKITQELQNLQSESKYQIQELTQRIKILESINEENDDELKIYKKLKASEELQDLEQLGQNMDSYFEAAQTQKKLIVKSLSNLSRLVDFKSLENDKNSRIKNAAIQTDDLADINFTMILKLENEAKLCKPFVNIVDKKLILDTFSSTQKSLRFDAEIDNTLQRLFSFKLQNDLMVLGNLKDSKIDSYSNFLVKNFIREHKIQELGIIHLCTLLKECEKKRTLLQQLQYIMLGLKPKFLFFTIPNIQFLVLGIFDDQARIQNNMFEIQEAIKYLFRVRQIYPSIVINEFKEERIQIIQQLLVFMLLKKELQDLQLWDFVGYQKIMERAKKMIELALYSNQSFQVDPFNITQNEGYQIEVLDLKKRNLNKDLSLSNFSQTSRDFGNKTFLKRSEMINAESGQQMIYQLAQLIINIIIKDQEQTFYKKLKSAFEENDFGKNGFIYQEQIKDILKKILHDFLSEFLLLVLNEYIRSCLPPDQTQITLQKLENFFKQNMGYKNQIPLEILLKVMCYKIQILVKYEQRLINKEVESTLRDHEFDKCKSQIFNYFNFKDILLRITGQKNQLEETQVLKIFQEISLCRDKLWNSKNRADLIQYTTKVISNANPLIANNDLLNPMNSKNLEKQLNFLSEKSYKHSKMNSHQSAILGSVNLSSRQSFKANQSSTNLQPMRRQSTLRMRIN